MKAIIENPLDMSNFAVNMRISIEFTAIITLITRSKTETELRGKVNNFKTKSEFFLWGFGLSHMWVKQIIDGDPKQQVIFVQL